MDILNSFNKEKTSYHTITTKHPYLSDMGLSQFTTGVLYEWWNKEKDGQFENRRLVIDLTASGNVTGAESPSPENLRMIIMGIKTGIKIIKENKLTKTSNSRLEILYIIYIF